MSDSRKLSLGICNKMLLTPTIADMHIPHSDFDILVTVRLYTVMTEVCHWLNNEKQRKTVLLLTDQ